MADFAEAIPDEQAGRRLARAIGGRGAFRRFKDELHDEYPYLLPLWYEFSGRCGIRRAVQWLADHTLVAADDADRFLADHPDIDLSEPAERDGARHPIGMLDLPLPEPAPQGSQWIAAYRRWTRL